MHIMKTAAPFFSSATTHRIGRFYTGRPSWRTGLRRLRRRLGERALPLSEEERLLDAAQTLRRAGGTQAPVQALRLVRPLPRVFLAADGRTTFRYGKVPKNASSSVLYMLLQMTGEAAYYPWDERKHFWLIRRIWQERVWEPCIKARFKQHIEKSARLTINDEQMRLHQYARSFPYAGPPITPLPDIRFCLVRDPVERFVSAYRQMTFRPYRLAYGREEGAEQKTPRRAKLAQRLQADAQERKRMPDIDGFIAAKETEKAAQKPGNIHFRAQKWFLGRPEYYTHIFSVRQLREVRDFLSELTQKPLVLPNINRTRRKKKILAAHPAARDLDFTLPPLTAQQKRRIETLYAEDYRLFGRYF